MSQVAASTSATPVISINEYRYYTGNHQPKVTMFSVVLSRDADRMPRMTRIKERIVEGTSKLESTFFFIPDACQPIFVFRQRFIYSYLRPTDSSLYALFLCAKRRVGIQIHGQILQRSGATASTFSQESTKPEASAGRREGVGGI